MKKTLTQKQIADYEQLCHDRNNGRLLTPDGQDYVSCSPFRVPIARLAAAQAAIKG